MAYLYTINFGVYITTLINNESFNRIEILHGLYSYQNHTKEKAHLVSSFIMAARKKYSDKNFKKITEENLTNDDLISEIANKLKINDRRTKIQKILE